MRTIALTVTPAPGTHDNAVPATTKESKKLDEKTKKLQRRAQQLEKNELQQYPKKYIRLLLIGVAIYITLSLAKGGKGFPSPVGIKQCSVSYYGVCALILGAAYAYYTHVASVVASEEAEKLRVGFDLNKYPPRLDAETAKNTGLLGARAGFLGGLIGIGGGMVLGPYWLQIGLPSMRMTATATFTVVFTSFSSLFTNFLAGNYTFSEIVFWGLISSVGSSVICNFLAYLVKKYRRDSIILGVLLIAMGASAVLLTFTSISKMVNDPSLITSFGYFC